MSISISFHLQIHLWWNQCFISFSKKMQTCHFRGTCDDGHKLGKLLSCSSGSLKYPEVKHTLKSGLVCIWSLGCLLGTMAQGILELPVLQDFSAGSLRKSQCHSCQGIQGGRCYAAAETETTSGYSWVSGQSITRENGKSSSCTSP